MLAPLQQQLRAIVDLLPEGEDFALAGGGALVVRGVITRLTSDLDYFGTSEEGVAPLADALESRLSALGYTVERTRFFPGFARFRVSTAGDSTTVDLGWDARLSPPERAGGGLVLAEAELAADKVLAVADRGEARDYIDLAALVERHGFWKAYSTAAEKQPGLDPRQLYYAFRYFGDVPRGLFHIPDASYAQLQDTVGGWRRELTRRIQGPESDMRLAAVGGPPGGLASPPRLEFSPPAGDTPCPDTNPTTVSVRPHRASDRGWELSIRGTAGAPLWVSEPYPTKGAAEGARNFALGVANGKYPLRIEGWTPAVPLRASYDPPPVEEATATVRVLPPSHPSGGWRLAATRPGRSTVIMSSPYADADKAQAALAFLGVLHVFAGPTIRTGQVRGTAHPDDQMCDCHFLGEGCRHHEAGRPDSRGPRPRHRGPSRRPERPADAPRRHNGPGPRGVSVRPFPLDDHGWEVTTTEPDGSPRQLSGPHPTLEEAEQVRDFIVQLVNTHPQLHIHGRGRRRLGLDAGGYDPPSRGEVPTVVVSAADEEGRWYLQAHNPDGTEHAISPPYATQQAAADALEQLGLLSAATAHRAIGQRATVEPTSTSCRCSWAGWRCGHTEVEPPEAEPPDRWHRLSL